MAKIWHCYWYAKTGYHITFNNLFLNKKCNHHTRGHYATFINLSKKGLWRQKNDQLSRDYLRLLSLNVKQGSDYATVWIYTITNIPSSCMRFYQYKIASDWLTLKFYFLNLKYFYYISTCFILHSLFIGELQGLQKKILVHYRELVGSRNHEGAPWRLSLSGYDYVVIVNRRFMPL